MIVTNVTDKGIVTGWTTNCFSCGDLVTFTKVDQLSGKGRNRGINESIKKPDSVARCHPCYIKALDRYRERHDL